MPQVEETEHYLEVVGDFLDSVEAGIASPT
jgi:hypothetical protein